MLIKNTVTETELKGQKSEAFTKVELEDGQYKIALNFELSLDAEVVDSGFPRDEHVRELLLGLISDDLLTVEFNIYQFLQDKKEIIKE